MILLNVGAGGTLPRGDWVNIDFPYEHPELGANYVRHDASTPLPFADGSVDGLIACHFIEHFDCLKAVEILRDFRRVLRPGGVCRIVVPNASYHRKVYPKDSEESAIRLFGEPLLQSKKSGVRDETFMSYALFWEDHKQVLTEDGLWCELVQAGFDPSHIYVVGHQQTGEPGHPCSAQVAALDNRALFSLRMEAMK